VRPSEKGVCPTQLFTAWATRKNDFVSFCVDVQLWVKNLNCWLTQSMQQSPSWEANNFSTSPKVSHIVWNLKVLYRVHHSSTLVPLPSQMNPAHNSPFYSLKVHFNMSSHGRLGLPRGLILSGFLTKIKSASCCFPCWPHADLIPTSFIHQLNLIWWRVKS